MEFSKAYLYFFIEQKKMSVEEFRNKIGLSMTTWYKRMNEPDTFSYEEIKTIKNALDLTLEELELIFFN